MVRVARAMTKTNEARGWRVHLKFIKAPHATSIEDDQASGGGNVSDTRVKGCGWMMAVAQREDHHVAKNKQKK
jgi:hypothetical protein